MDNAPDYGSGDSRFESWQARKFFSYHVYDLGVAVREDDGVGRSGDRKHERERRRDGHWDHQVEGVDAQCFCLQQNNDLQNFNSSSRFSSTHELSDDRKEDGGRRSVARDLRHS